MPNILTDAQVAFFHEEGYLAVPSLLPPDDLEPVRREIASLVHEAALRFQAEGRIERTHEAEPFETRLTRLLEDHPELTRDYLRAIEGRGGGGHAGKAMYGLITHPNVLDMAEQLLGPEIVGSSVYRIRPKVPGLERGVVPWHQDSGYFAPHCDAYLVLTVWIPLVDATPENGCLQVLPRTHRQGIFPHHTGGPGGYLVIEDADLPSGEVVTVPVPKGGALLLSNLAPHCSTPNTSDTIRWSVDLRYQSRSAPTNAFELPEEFDSEAPRTTWACYPPEGDFVVRSRAHPEQVHSYAQFAARRAAYEAATHIPYPARGWTPAEAPKA